jgi:hypothetical protein
LWGTFSLASEAELLKVPLTTSVREMRRSEQIQNNYERKVVMTIEDKYLK